MPKQTKRKEKKVVPFTQGVDLRDWVNAQPVKFQKAVAAEGRKARKDKVKGKA